MAVRSGNQYLSSLSKGKEIWLDGEKIDDVRSNPTLKSTLDAFSRYYDLVNESKHNQLLKFTSPSTGDLVSIFFQIPHSMEDLERRRRALEFVTREFGGLLTRMPDYDQALMVGLMNVKEELGAENKAFATNIEEYFVQMRESDAMSVTTFNDPQINRGKGLEEQGALKIVDRRSNGIVVRGARTLVTNAPFANNLLCLRKPLPPDAVEFCNDFWISMNTEGLKMICRPSLVGKDSSKGNTMAGRYDEIDALMIFEDVFVPNENIFLIGRPDIANKTWSGITSISPYHDHIRTMIKAELILGITSLIVDYIGTSKFPAVMSNISEMIQYVETLRTFAKAAEAQCVTTSSGLVVPNKLFLDLARFYHHKSYPKMISLIHNLSGQSLLASVTTPYFERKEILPYLEKYFAGTNVSAQNKAKLFRLAWDIACDGFGGRQTMYELFNAAAEHTLRDRLVKKVDRSPYVEMAKQIAGIDE